MTRPIIAAPPADTAERREYYDRIGQLGLSPLWLSLANLVTPEPVSACQPASWTWSSLRPAMSEAGGLITAHEAERRVLILENPGMRGQSRITTDLYAGIQMILPGEIAPAHRHAQAALRFVLEGRGAYTTVDGVRAEMEFGDLIITPPMTWHDHENVGDEAVYWFDGLDIPLVQFLDASFAEKFKGDVQPVVDGAVFRYPYSLYREELAGGAIDACHGVKIRYTDPSTGRSPMATIAPSLQLLPQGFVSAPYRSTDATVFVVAEGRGRTRIGPDFVVDWTPRDVFVVPSWKHVVHEAAEESVLFSFSDRPVQEALHLFREERGDG